MRPLLLCAVLLGALAHAAGEPKREKNVLDHFDEWLRGIQKPKEPPPEQLGAQNTITINPLALQYEQLGIEYERGFWKRFSIYFAPQAAYGLVGDNWDLAAGLNAGVRFFFLGAAPAGIFLGPDVSAQYVRRKRGGSLRSGLGLGIGASVGWTLIFFDRLTLSVGFAAQHRSQPDLEAEAPEDQVRIQFSPLPRFAFGIAF